MSKSRKTIAVTDLVDRANAFLAIGELPGIVDAQFREGVSQLLEYVLFETGNWNGFRYQKSEKLENGELKENFDRTRRTYYHPKGN